MANDSKFLNANPGFFKENDKFNRSLRDKLAQLENDKKQRNTYHQHSQSDESGGRYRTAEKRPVVIGTVNDPSTQALGLMARLCRRSRP